MASAIWWLRRDLRLTDNPALETALSQGGNVIPVFVFDPALWQGQWFSPRRAAFLVAHLHRLDADLRTRGSYLLMRRGQPEKVLWQLMAETGASVITTEREYSPYAVKRDQAAAQNLPLQLVHGSVIHTPEAVLKPDGNPYQVYTPFMRRWKQLPVPTPHEVLPMPERIPTPIGLRSDQPPHTESYDWSVFPPGESEAQARLAAFTDEAQAPVYQYSPDRDRPDLPATSQLSPYLRFGVLSLRQAVVAAQSAVLNARDEPRRKSAETWLNQLIWREFFTSILNHHPRVRHEAFRKEYQGIPWSRDQQDFAAWKAGQTGYPLVDAGMRQLAATGWMHNRVRMVTASFLVKNLLIDWRWGEAWFMQNLLDGDPAVNNGSWQWVAGTGTDAAPYFRIFNPVTQSKKFDPHGVYIRSWVPELAAVPDRYLHTPWMMNAAQQQSSGIKIGEDYPHPIIDLQFSRQRALAAYKKD